MRLALAAEAAILLHEHPAWAVWLPHDDRGEWTAARAASSRPPGPAVPLLWLRAGSADELARMMRAADTAL